jgi:toxin FitB
MTRMYLLDTNVVSELRKPKPHGAVMAWFEALEDTQLHLSAVTIGEIQAGIELTREQDEAKALEIEAWLEMVSADGRAFLQSLGSVDASQI